MIKAKGLGKGGRTDALLVELLVRQMVHLLQEERNTDGHCRAHEFRSLEKSIPTLTNAGMIITSGSV